MRNHLFALAGALCLATSLPASTVAQTGETVTLAAGPDYARSAAYRLFWGTHHRDAWTTPVRVSVLDLSSFAGGLTPLSAGGGFQTKSLWLTGLDERTYAFRSVYKFAQPLVPEVFHDTFVEDLFQDQMSTQHPYSSPVVESLLGSAGILSTPPSLFVLPDDPALGEFRADFAGVLGMLMERPDENESSLIAFHGATEIIDGDEVLERVQSDPSQRVDSRTYLAARLVDVLVGDWDRHAGQWRWASFPGDTLAGWQPIPRDRDQAFARFDGLMLGIAFRRAPMLTNYRATYDSPSRLHYQARFTDRLYLSELDRTVWDSTAAKLVARLTDDEIDRAIRKLPPEILAIDGETLASTLRVRRDALPEVASGLYEMMAREAYIHGTDVAEVAEVSLTPDGVRISIRTDGPDALPYFDRTFRPSESREVRLHMHGGDDVIVVRGEGRFPPHVRLLGGPGDDEYRFEGPVEHVDLYDFEGVDRVTGTASGKTVDAGVYEPTPLIPEGGSEAPSRHWGKFGYPVSMATYDPDHGLVVQYGHTWFDYGFRKDPYASRTELKGTVATALKAAVQFEADFRFENSSWATTVAGFASSLETLHFYGIGNDTEKRDDVPSDFYDVDRVAVQGEWRARTDLGDLSTIGIGIAGQYSSTEDDSTSFLGGISELYGVGGFGSVGAVATLDLTTRRPGFVELFDNKVRAGLGVRGAFYPAVLDVEEAYGTADLSGNLAFPVLFRQSEIGFRAGGRKVWGDAPFFDLAYIGGGSSLRGLPLERFAGDASLYGAAELRLDLFDYRFIFPSTFGILGLIDTGRVWEDGESPGGWHAGYGGGIWLALRGTRNVLSIAYATGTDDQGLYIAFGFPF